MDGQGGRGCFGGLGDIYKSGDPPAAFDKKGFQPILLSGMMPLEVGEGGCGTGSIVSRARLIITCTPGVGAAAGQHTQQQAIPTPRGRCMEVRDGCSSFSGLLEIPDVTCVSWLWRL